MGSVLVKFLQYFISTKIIKVILLSSVEVLVARTDNKIDDEILQKVKEKLE